VRWSAKLIDLWCEYYEELRNYELNPFETRGVFRGEEFISGLRSHSPYEELADMNWDFDKALKKLGTLEKVFRMRFIDGYSVEEVVKECECRKSDIAKSRRMLIKLLESENERTD